MKRSALILTAAACLALTGAAVAQVPRGFTPQGVDQQRLEGNHVLNSAYFDSGVKALQSKNYAVAETVFDDILQQNRNHADANFLMGVAKMGLEKWDDAKKYLEIAAKKAPKNPDPKSRLGITLIKLGDIGGAMKQRDELVKMDKECKGSCRNASYITDGIAMIDGALPPKQP